MSDDLSTGPDPLIRRFQNFFGHGCDVTVTVSGGAQVMKEATMKEATMRITAVLDDPDGRFDVMKLGIRGALTALLVENRQLSENLAAVQKKSGELLEIARSHRKRLMELGDSDPGMP